MGYALSVFGLLVGKWQGAVTQVLAVAASVVIYYPFVKALDRQYQKKKPMKYQKHCRERGVKEMHVENDKNICCEVEKEWKKCIIRWCPSWFKPLPFIFQLTKNLWREYR